MPSFIAPAEPPQSRYQVRLHIGIDPGGLLELSRCCDVLIVVDVLDDGVTAALGSVDFSAASAEVIVAGLRTRAATARAVLDAQARLGARAFVSIVTVGRTGTGTGSSARPFAVEDFLAAGAVVDALAELGIDYSSPEAAAACAAFVSLRGAVGHLVTASETGQEWIARGLAAELAEATRVDASDSLLSIS